MKIPYKSLLVGPVLLFALGFILNAIVVRLNHSQMPVFPPGGDCSLLGSSDDDPIHVCMTHATHLKFLADWIILNMGVASPGDCLEWASEHIQFPAFLAWIFLSFRSMFVKSNL